MGTICSSLPRRTNMDKEKIDRWHRDGLRNSFGCMESFETYLDEKINDENISKDNLLFIKRCTEMFQKKTFTREKLEELLELANTTNVNLNSHQINQLEELTNSERLENAKIMDHLKQCCNDLEDQLKENFDDFIQSLRKK